MTTAQGFNEELKRTEVSEPQRAVPNLEAIQLQAELAQLKAEECDWLRRMISWVETATPKWDGYNEARNVLMDVWNELVRHYHAFGCTPALKHHDGFGESNP